MNKIKERCPDCGGKGGFDTFHDAYPGPICKTCQGTGEAKTTLEERLELEVEVNRSKK